MKSGLDTYLSLIAKVKTIVLEVLGTNIVIRPVNILFDSGKIFRIQNEFGALFHIFFGDFNQVFIQNNFFIFDYLLFILSILKYMELLIFQ